jgi:hypothetical protein
LEPLDLPFPGLKGRRNWRPNDPYGFNWTSLGVGIESP